MIKFSERRTINRSLGLTLNLVLTLILLTILASGCSPSTPTQDMVTETHTATPSIMAGAPAYTSSPLHADQIGVFGTVEIWSLDQATNNTVYYHEDDNYANIVGGRYIPARNIFITQEFQGLVSDPVGYTDKFGNYYLKKSGLVEDTNYNVNLEVRAKAILGTYGNPLLPSEVTVSVFQDSTDLYEINGETAAISYHTGAAYEYNIKIGGPQDSGITWWDDVYCDWTLTDCRDYRGEDDNLGIHPVAAFWMTQVLQDFVKGFTLLAPNLNQIDKDTWIIYPAMNDSTHYAAYAPPPGIGSIDMSNRTFLFPSQFGSGMNTTSENLGNNWRKFRQSLIHEYSHKIMHEVYWAMPEPNLDEFWNIGNSEHNVESCVSQELAWKEGFAEFLPAAIADIPQTNGSPGLSNIEYSYYPPEYLDNSGYIQDTPIVGARDINFPHHNGEINWHYNVTRSCNDLRNNEGEVAAVLWDIYDPQGWEYLNAIAQPEILFWERPVKFYDRLDDSGLSDIWDEVRYYEPDSINDEGDIRQDSFWTDWVNSTYPNNVGMIHGLKAILYNRGIPTTTKPENAPVVEAFAIDVPGRKLTFRIGEVDSEDQPYLFYNVGYMKDISGNEFSYFYNEDRPLSELTTDWQDGELLVSVEIPRGKLGRINGIMVHDSMEIGYRGQNVSLEETHIELSCFSKQTSNFASSVAVQNNFAYMADMEDGLYVYDLSDPLKPVKVAQLQGDMSSEEFAWGGAMDVKVQGNYAFLAAYSGHLVVVDIRQPARPLLAAIVELGGDPRALAIGDKKVYILNGSGGLEVVNILYPDSPWLETSVDTNDGMDIVISADKAYVGTGSGLEIYSLGMVPMLWGAIPTPGEAVSAVAVGPGGLVYLATREGNLKVYDISTWNPTLAKLQPFTIKQFDPELAYPILLAELPVHALTGGAVLAGDTLFIGGSVFDVSEPELIYAMTENNDLDDSYDIAVTGNVVYTAAGSSGLKVFSTTAQASGDACGSGSGQAQGGGILEAAGVWNGHINDMAFTGGYGYLAAGEAGLKIISVDPTGSIQSRGAYTQWTAVEAYKLDTRGVDISPDGDLVYMSSMKGDLQILDIANPVNPIMLGMVEWNRHENVGQWSDVAGTDQYVFVCSGTGGIRGLDVRDASNPPWRGTVNKALNDCTDVMVQMPYVYALGSSSGLHVFELMGQDSNSMPDLYEVATWKIPEGASGSAYSTLALDPQRKLLYVSMLWNGVAILDVKDPSHPQVLSRIDPGSAYGLALSGKYLFVGDDLVVHAIDVNNPAIPLEVAAQELTDRYGMEIAAINLKVYADILFVATNQDTLQAYLILKE